MSAKRLLTPREYAEHIGVTRQAVMYAIVRGRIPESARTHDPKKKCWLIDPELADPAWHANTRQRQGIHDNREAPPGATTANDLVAPGAIDGQLRLGPNDLPVDEDGRPLPPMMVTAWKTAVEAKLKQLELAERKKHLVPFDEAAKTLANVGRSTRDAVLAVPARLAHQLAAETDATQVEILLERALTDALLALCPPDSAP